MNTDEQHFDWKYFFNMLILIIPQLGFFCVWALCMALLLRINSCSTQQSTAPSPNGSPPPEKTEVLVLKEQLNEMKSANGKLFDLVIATLGTVVTIAVAVPALTVISQVIANQETIDNIQTNTQKKVDRNLENALNKFSDKIYFNFFNDLETSYQTFNLSINKNVEKFRDIIELKLKQKGVTLDSNDSLDWIEKLSKNQIEQFQIEQLDKDDFKRIQIYRYPLLLQDCIKVLEILNNLKNNLKSSDKIDQNLLSIRIKRHLKIVQLPLIIMTYSEHISDKLYVAPKPQSSQIKALKEIIKNFNEQEVTTISQLLDQVDTNIDFSRL